MRWTIYFTVVCVGYTAGMLALIREYRTHTAKERFELQTVPIIVGVSMLFLALIYKGIVFCSL